MLFIQDEMPLCGKRAPKRYEEVSDQAERQAQNQCSNVPFSHEAAPWPASHRRRSLAYYYGRPWRHATNSFVYFSRNSANSASSAAQHASTSGGEL